MVGVTDPEAAAERPVDGRRWPLTRTLPLGVALAMFMVAVLTTQIGLRVVDTRDLRALEGKAEVVLDALADSLAPVLGAGEARVAAHLAAQRLLREALVGEPLVVRWTEPSRDAAAGAVVLGSGAADIAALQRLADEVGRDGPGRLAFDLERERGLAFAAKRYALDGRLLTIAGVLDTREILAAGRTAERSALMLDLLLAAVAAALIYVATRWALAPFARMAEALARTDGELSLGAGPDRSAELGRFEAAIKARLEAEAARNVALRDLGEKDRNALLAKLAAGLAHEVRNPLAGLLNAVSTLRRFGDDAKVRNETLDLVERGLRSIGRVADTMLTTYRPATGRAVFTADDLNDLQLLIVPEARHRGVSIDWRVAGFQPLAVDADALRQILLNLLLNACRASTAGGEIVFSVEQTAAESSFTITDNGPGMPDAVLAFLVDGAKLAPMIDSKGLGLWLVTRLLEDIGGRIKVESRSGRGTSVSVRIPAATVAAAAASAVAPQRGTVEA